MKQVVGGRELTMGLFSDRWALRLLQEPGGKSKLQEGYATLGPLHLAVIKKQNPPSGRWKSDQGCPSLATLISRYLL